MLLGGYQIKVFKFFLFSAIVFLTGCQNNSAVNDAAAYDYDIVIYGGTSAAVTAAVQAVQMDKSVVIVSPDRHLGGLSSGGLGWTDSGDKSVIGGLSRQFYHRIWLHYDKSEAWK